MSVEDGMVEEAREAAYAGLAGLIVRDPQMHSGRPTIAGTGVTVRAIAGLYKVGLNAEEIAGEMSLKLAQVYAALTYYHLHTGEIEADIEADSEAALREQYTAE